MKILITTDSYSPSINGVVTSILTLEKELIKHGHDVRILTLKQKQHNMPEEVASNVYYIPSMSAEKIYPDARILRSFAKTQVKKIIEWSPDIIHSQSEFSTFTLAHRLSKYMQVPLVHTYHTVYEDYTHYFSPSKRVGKKVVEKFSDFVLGKTDGIITPTEKVRHLLSEYGIKKPLYTIPTGINLSLFQQTYPAEKREEARKKRGISKNQFALLFLGRLAKEKNVEELIRLLSEFPNSNVVLLIAGDGPNRDSLEKLAKHYGIQERVHFLGMFPHSEVSEIYHLADVFVSASTSETQGLTYIEAQASGLPVICRKDDCLTDLIVQGQNGCLYETREEFGVALREIIAQPEELEKMKENGRQIAKEYSSEVFGKRVLSMYKHVIEEYEEEHVHEKEEENSFSFDRK